MALAAQVRIPVPGSVVPMTLQSLVILLAGFALSPSRVVAGMTLYLALGTCGLPVFTPQSQGLVGVTGGYLVGFVAAAWIISWLKGKGTPTAVRLAFSGGAGLAVLFVSGLLGVTLFFGGDWSLAVKQGLVPFAVKALVQLALAVALVLTLRGARKYAA